MGCESRDLGCPDLGKMDALGVAGHFPTDLGADPGLGGHHRRLFHVSVCTATCLALLRPLHLCPGTAPTAGPSSQQALGVGLGGLLRASTRCPLTPLHTGWPLLSLQSHHPGLAALPG